MLEDKLRDATHVSNADAKRDIMSILVRAKKAYQQESSEDYAMNDQSMRDQVVGSSLTPTWIYSHPLTGDSSHSLALGTKP
jgi:hypothetical protein